MLKLRKTLHGIGTEQKETSERAGETCRVISFSLLRSYVPRHYYSPDTLPVLPLYRTVPMVVRRIPKCPTRVMRPKKQTT